MVPASMARAVAKAENAFAKSNNEVERNAGKSTGTAT